MNFNVTAVIAVLRALLVRPAVIGRAKRWKGTPSTKHGELLEKYVPRLAERPVVADERQRGVGTLKRAR